MLLTISITRPGATDLGYLLHKNPSRVHSFSLSFGQAHVFYPEATSARCTAALLLTLDPIGLVRGKKDRRPDVFALQQYVNDRPYAATSFLSVALAKVFGTAMNGRCKDRPELADEAIPLEATIAALPCRTLGRPLEGIAEQLFEPLGYEVSLTRYPLDEKFADWGESPYCKVQLKAKCASKICFRTFMFLFPSWTTRNTIG